MILKKTGLKTHLLTRYVSLLIVTLLMTSCSQISLWPSSSSGYKDSSGSAESSLPIGQGELDTTRKSGEYYTQLNAKRNKHLPKGKPYTVMNQTYVPYTSAHNFEEIGVASWYGPGFHGKLTANGEKYNQNGISAAHKLLPFGTMVRVTNLDNGQTIVVRVNDRGPFLHGRIIDLSKGAADAIQMTDKGTAKVHLEVAGGSGRSSYGAENTGGAISGGSSFVSSDPNEFGDDPTFYDNVDNSYGNTNSGKSKNYGSTGSYNAIPSQSNSAPSTSNQPMNQKTNFSEQPVYNAASNDAYNAAYKNNTDFANTSTDALKANDVSPYAYGGVVSTPQNSAEQPLNPMMNEKYYVQLGIFKYQNNANGLVQSLAGNGVTSQVFVDTNLYFVQAGPYSSKVEAVQVKNRLNLHFPESYFVIR